MCVYVVVQDWCVCVCVWRERERVRERALGISTRTPIPFNLKHFKHAVLGTEVVLEADNMHTDI